MGLTDSPYQYFQLLIHFKFIAYRDRKDALNPFQCSHANLNLQGDEQYTPQLPWVMKVRSYGHLESEVFISFFSFFFSLCLVTETRHLVHYWVVFQSQNSGYPVTRLSPYLELMCYVPLNGSGLPLPPPPPQDTPARAPCVQKIFLRVHLSLLLLLPLRPFLVYLPPPQ